MSEKKRKRGRPSTYDPAYCEQVIELGRKGKSQVQISAALDIPRTTMRQWAERHEDFASALTRAKELEQAYWEELGEKGLFADRFNAPVWKMMMASRFRADYSPTTRIEGSGGGAIQITLSRDDEKL